MAARIRPRFSSLAAALRFYFRMHELFCRSRGTREIAPLWLNPRVDCAASAFDDFLAINDCLRELKPFEHHILSEFYGPTCFAPGQRSLARTCRSARASFPNSLITPGIVERIRRRTLRSLAPHLESIGLIGPPIRMVVVVAKPWTQRLASARPALIEDRPLFA